jgi:hypothetical protein
MAMQDRGSLVLARERLVSGDRSVVDRWEHVRPFPGTYAGRRPCARNAKISIVL